MMIRVAVAAAAIAIVLPVVGGADEQAPAELRTVWSGIYTKEQAERGRATYLSKCAKCHAESLAGNPPAPALKGTGFTTRWNGQTVRDIQSLMRSTMPLDLPGSLTREETFEIASYIFQENGFPAGEKELAGLPAELKQIQITPQKDCVEKSS
ncbi:MAG: c-type cytochrome [Dehalococcoidia bacterium]